MMRTMRASAKWIMGVVAFFFVGWMVYGYGMDAAGRGSAAPNVLAKVNGRTVDAQTFYNAVRAEQERRRQEQAPALATLEEQRQLEDAVLEQFVQSIVLEQEFRRRGIQVSNAEIIEAARTTPPPEVLELEQFQTEGQFDFQKYQRFIASSADPAFLMALEARYRDELPRIKLYEQLTAGVFVSDAELWRKYRDRNDSVTATVVQVLPPTPAGDSAAEVTDAEMEAYYRGHREEFERPAAAFLSFLAISRRPNAADSVGACTGRTDGLLDSTRTLVGPLRSYVAPSSTDPVAVVSCYHFTVAHELGHGLGLFAHSANIADLMYVVPRRPVVSINDRFTLQRLYRTNATILPPAR